MSMTMDASVLAEELALLGGPKAVEQQDAELFRWPIVTAEDEAAVLEVLRAGSMSGLNITRQFEAEWSAYLGVRFSLAHCNGTASLLAAMFACGVGRGDEIIAPSVTYWATAMPALQLGASVVFADINPVSLCIDPHDIEHRITPRTRAIVVVHYCGHPCDMDLINAIARRHGLKVIEDVSHAHGSRYKGRMTGTLGDVAAMSMMAGKSFPIGEGGMLSTNDPMIHQRAICFGHYERVMSDVTDPALRAAAGPEGCPTAMPLGGVKHRLNQTCAAMGRVQLRHYEQRINEIQAAINRFWDLLEDCPGLRPHRPDADSGSTMGGWYNPVGHYVPEELGGLPVAQFVKAVHAEGGQPSRGCNYPMHLHPVLNNADVYGDGKPTRNAFAGRDLRQPAGSLPVAERLASRCLGIPYFKHDAPQAIARYAAAWRKVAEQAEKVRRHFQ